jgi:hypothetical protein
MSDSGRHAANLRERLASGTEDKIGKALADLLENPLVTGTIGRAFDARERASQAQELALGALNLPTAADIERLTRRLRSVSQRLEGIEDGVHRLNRALSDGAIDTRLSTLEEQLKALSGKLAGAADAPSASEPAAGAGSARASAPPASKRAASAKSAPKRAARARSASKPAAAPRRAAASRAKKTP